MKTEQNTAIGLKALPPLSSTACNLSSLRCRLSWSVNRQLSVSGGTGLPCSDRAEVRLLRNGRDGALELAHAALVVAPGLALASLDF